MSSPRRIAATARSALILILSGVLAGTTLSIVGPGAATRASAAEVGAPFTSAQLNAQYESDALPYPNYFRDALSGFATLKADHPEILTQNDQTVVRQNSEASAAQVQRALTDAHTDSALTMADSLGSTLGPLYLDALNDGDLPKTKALLVGSSALVNSGLASTDNPKNFYDNPRPYVALGFTSDGGSIVARDTAANYAGLADQGSYPSGHTDNAYWQATTLATLLPELAPQILARASEAGNNRLVLGYHYPLDVIAGRMMGQNVVEMRWSDPQFRTLLKEAKTEVETVLSQKCGETLAKCIADQTPYLSTSAALDVYRDRLDYGFSAVGSTSAVASVPDGAENLLLTAFPSLSDAQRRQVLAATEIASGDPLDTEDGSGSWERLDLAAAMAAHVSVASDGTLTVNGTAYKPATSKTVADLEQDDALQQRSLSTPNSRIVLNPLDYGQGKTEAQTSGGPQLPLGAAYYAADDDNVTTGLMSVYEKTGAGSSSGIFHDGFSSLSTDWTATDLKASVADSALTLSLPDSAPKNWGNITRSVTADLDQTPLVTITVPSTSGAWALKVNDGTLADDISLTGGDVTSTGTLTFDLAQATGWSGTKTFSLRIFETGRSKSLTVSSIGMTGSGAANGFVDTFETLSSAWSARKGVSASASDSQLVLSQPASASSAWGGVARSVTVDLDEYPVVALNVTGGTGLWSLKVNSGTGSDIELQHDSSTTGLVSYDVAKKTGWTGKKTFTLMLNVVGKGTNSSFDSVSFAAQSSSLAASTSHQTAWRADSLPFSATYASGGVMAGEDLFHDADSVTRLIKTSGFESTAPTLTGVVNGTGSYDASTKLLTVSNDSWSYAVDLAGLSGIAFYSSEANLANGSGASATPVADGYWSAVLPAGGTAVGVGFATAADGAAAARSRAVAASDPATALADVREWTKYWNGVLAKVPVPATFALTAVNDDGVSAAQVEKMYYLAWIMMEENVLPKTPETGFDYPQVATGKASGWMKGPAGSRASATWDSLLGMQYLAYIDPEVAKASFTGMMSLTDTSGQLGGESLPSIKAQTAWTLYQTTGDESVLSDSYADLTRYLDWAAQNLRWIYGSHDYSNEHDSEFAISLLVDYEYAEKISAQLGKSDDVAAWKTAQQKLSDEYDSWFLKSDGSLLQYYFTGEPDRDSLGTNVVVTSGLHATSLSAAAMAATVSRFEATFDPDAVLAGLNGVNTTTVKVPDAAYTAYGLLDQGMPDEAKQWVEAIVRDIVRTGQFSETYSDPTGDGPVAGGVRPSVFGAVNVIDFVWMMNGVRSDQGAPTAVNLTDASGGVSGLTWQGKDYSISLHADGVAKFSGAAIPSTGCTSVSLAYGASYTLGDDGSDCSDAHASAWSPDASYSAGARVTDKGSTWLASWETTGQEPSDPNGPWQEIPPTGADGAAAWAASRIYVAGDVVEYSGSRFTAQWWTRNQAPGDDNGPWTRQKNG